MNPITNIFNTVQNSFLHPAYSGLLLTIATVAAIAFIVLVIRGATDPRNERRTGWIAGCVALFGVCLIAAFVPDIVNWIMGLGGSGSISSVS